jgi:ATP/maltotriose-dependent transcriptional regulator MalT
VLDFTRGHPLALSLVADVLDQRQDQQFVPDEAPDVIQTLLERFVQKVPSPAHRTALEACALFHLTTEALLAEILQVADGHELFDWLRSLSFIQYGKEGLFPHDLVRDVLCADLQWRNPDWYAELHHRARVYYMKRLQQTRGDEQRRVLVEYIYLHRRNPIVRHFGGRDR